MKRTLVILFLFAFLFIGAKGQSDVSSAKPHILPEVTSWTSGQGTVVFSRRIVVKSKDMRQAALALATDYETLFHAQCAITTGKAHRGDIVVERNDQPVDNCEGYTIHISDHIAVSAPTPLAAFWATRSLLQMMLHSAELPCGTIADIPQYPLRGMLFDVGRKYVPMSYLQKLVRIMGFYKMNTLQLHLNDNGFPKFFDNDWLKTQAAFRLQCDTYPGLTAQDGSYTKDEFIQLQQLAQANGVEIIPEIDSPAHSLAFTHYRPSLASKDFGMDHLDLSNPEVYTFIDALFNEYLTPQADGLPVFRGPRVNIGTDEYSNANRQTVEQFRTYTDHLLALVQSHGKQPMLWGALTHAKGQTPVRHEGVLMNCWSNGFAQPDSMRQLGYQLVSIPDGLVYIVPRAGYYQDYLDCRYLYANWTPAVIGDKRFAEQDPQIEGGMFALWNDIPDPSITIDELHKRIVPALKTIAAKTWTGQLVTLPFDHFETLGQQLDNCLPALTSH